MPRHITISGLVVMSVLASIPVAADEHDLSELMGQHVLQNEGRGPLTSTPGFARHTVVTCAQHKQAVSELTDHFRQTGQALSLLSMAQQAPATAQEVRTRIATMIINRLVSQGQEALSTIIQDLEAEVLFACYEGALRAAQHVQQPNPAPTPPLMVEPPSSQFEPPPQGAEAAPQLLLEAAPPAPVAGEAAQPAPMPEPPPVRSAPPQGAVAAPPTPVVAEAAQPASMPEPPPVRPTPPQGAEAAPQLLPWGVILAVQGNREAAERQAAGTAGLILEERITYVKVRVPGLSDQRHVAQVGRATRSEAEELCRRLRAEGTACMVLRN